MKPIVVTIGGSDPYSGGGIQTDLLTFQAHGVFGISVCTSIVTNVDHQFTIHPIESSLLKAQLASLSEVEISVIKIGLIASFEQVELIERFLQEHPTSKVVCDPVFALKETTAETNRTLSEQLMHRLAPYVTIATPNLIEAAALVNQEQPKTVTAVADLAKKVYATYHVPICVKEGGRLKQQAAYDFLVINERVLEFKQTLIGYQVNGAGCAFASAIAANLALQKNVVDAVSYAKEFVHQAIEQSMLVTKDFRSIVMLKEER